MPSCENKKKLQLGMHHGTAGNRLSKDLLFHLLTLAGKSLCHQCGEELTRQSFTIEHIIPWLDSEDPKGLFFDLDNIAFSHIWCNSSASRAVGNRGQILLDKNKDKRQLKAKTYIRPFKRKEDKQEVLNL